MDDKLTRQPTLASLEDHDAFVRRHIGTSDDAQAAMLDELGFESIGALMDSVVPAAIRLDRPLPLPAPCTEAEALAKLRRLAAQNRIVKSVIGQGYYGTETPAVILRNVLENPAWYTAYTPYQPEISQGRLEALLNFQTMVCDLTAMPIANASMLDEATAAAEAMTLARRSVKSKSNTFVVFGDCHPQTIEVVQTRAAPLGIQVVVANSAAEWEAAMAGDFFGALIQYPASTGWVHDWKPEVEKIHAKQAAAIVAADLLALTLLVPPGEWGADIVVGTTQRFGMPMGAGGP